MTKKEKYIELLLRRCLNFNNSKSLFICVDSENTEFADEIAEEARKMGITDIAFEVNDQNVVHDVLRNISIEEIEKHPLFDRSVWNVYAEKNASFLRLDTEMPGIMDDIEAEKIAKSEAVIRSTKWLFKEKQLKYEIPWTIAVLPSKSWSKQIFPDDENAYDKLFELIYDACMINTEDPIASWNKTLKKSFERVEKLMALKIKSLHYTNSIGTDLTVYLSESTIWKDANKEGMIVNMPSYEIFTSPDFRKTEGIVYSSRPLVYNGKIIDEFYIKFKDGKAVEYDAKVGCDLLGSILTSDEQSGYLGEAALVNYDSPISNTGKVFYTTLFDENASCHLALGNGFPNTIKDGNKLSKEKLMECGINQSKIHVDFMIGTKDLNIVAQTFDGKNIQIFKDGNFCI